LKNRLGRRAYSAALLAAPFALSWYSSPSG
jgi:hypothetical protein